MEKTVDSNQKKTKSKVVSYAKWGYIFILPFFAIYLIFTLYPQITTIIYSFFDYYELGLDTYGPEFVGFKNYVDLFTLNSNGQMVILNCLWNTIIMWVMGAVVQLLLSLLLALFFTSTRLNIKGAGFFKSVFYMPNLIMASAFAFLFFAVFNTVGPVNQILSAMGIIGDVAEEGIDFIGTYPWSTRSLVAFMNFLMWFGNTTILLMAGIMGIDESLFESARVDGASSTRVFFDITLPLLKPILVYVLITSMIGGLQMFDVPQVLSAGTGNPNKSTKTLVMLLNENLKGNSNYGVSGAIAVVLFIITAVLSILVFKSITKKDDR
ncbi:MAG: sugar ABC transporter permease [Acholeplasmatales bacterium]|nr:sugar ABC transporter permease [Acholeplasmatales bacterium]